MEHLPKRITENGIDYILVGDYYIPDLRLPEESRPIGRWGRMHRDYLKEWRPVLYNDLLLSGRFWTYLADLNEQAQNRLEVITEQMKAASMLPFRNWTKPCDRLISRIVVGEMKKVDGQKQQEVKIIYNFVGEIPE